MLREELAACSARRPGGRRDRCAAGPAATERGDSTCTTRSTAPMSMPSSSEDVAHQPLEPPDLSSSSIAAGARATASRGGPSPARRRPAARRPARPRRARGSRRSSGQLVEPRGQPLGQPAGVDEDQRGPVRSTSSSSRGCIDGQMLRRNGPAAAGPVTGSSMTSPSAPMSSTGTIDLDLERLAHAGVDDRDRPAARPSSSRPPRKRAISSSGRWVADRPMRCGGRSQSASSRSRVRARCAPRLVAATRVDLVDDHRLDVAQRLAGRRREHEVERLGRRDEEVGRVAHEPAPLVRGRVAGAHADGRLVDLDAEPLGRQPDARQRGAEVLLDVDRQRSQRRDVEQAGALAPSSGGGSLISRSMPHRNAASVLPEPVGPGSACGRRRRWRASPAAGPRWARRRSCRTTPAPAARTNPTNSARAHTVTTHKGGV